MPEKKTIEKARTDLKQGKSASTAAGEFVREEIEHIRHGKHGARSAKQAIAIGLSKARRAGVPLPAPKSGQVSESTRRSAQRDAEIGQGIRKPRPSAKRSRAMRERLKREPTVAASKVALSRHAKAVARRRTKTKQTSATPKRSPAARKRRPAGTTSRSTTRSPKRRGSTRSSARRTGAADSR